MSVSHGKQHGMGQFSTAFVELKEAVSIRKASENEGVFTQFVSSGESAGG